MGSAVIHLDVRVGMVLLTTLGLEQTDEARLLEVMVCREGFTKSALNACVGQQDGPSRQHRRAARGRCCDAGYLLSPSQGRYHGDLPKKRCGC